MQLLTSVPFKLRHVLAIGMLFLPSVASAQIKAFPQAEGAGAIAHGGRGGDVYHVTNLNDSGAGSLRFGIDNAPTSGRTIVFDVGGWITINSKLGINSDKRNITIAGQTAPGGVGVRGDQFSIGGDDIIVRHMRFRPGKAAGSDTDSAGANVDAERIIYDHISAEFSTDGGFDSQATDLTLQFSSVSYGLQTHSTGALLENAHRLTMHHNLWANNNSRNPKHRVWEVLDWVDNVVYNWDARAIELQGNSDGDPYFQWTANIDGNYFIAGPDDGGVKPLSGGSTVNYETWWGTNAYDADGDSVHDGLDYSFGDRAFGDVSSALTRWRLTPFPVADEVWKDASTQAAYERTLSEFGATPWARDEVDSLLHDSVVNRTGSIITRESDLVPLGVSNGGFGTIGGGVKPPDTDGDGMPDAWELKHGTNPNVANNNGDFDQDGYTDLEEYLNDLAAFPATGPLEFSGIGRYADWKRWTNRWEPSRVDEVHVNNAAAFVDAVGQNAGTLRVGQGGRLYVTSGWLEVADDLQVGGDGVGSVRQYGGEVRVLGGGVDIQDGDYQLIGGRLATPLLNKAAGATFSLTGGELSADTVEFDLVNQGGAIAPGNGIGSTSILGDLTLLAGSLKIDVASAALIDSLTVSGTATLGGALNVSLLNGYLPGVGQSWQLLSASQILGSFSSITPGYSIQQQGNSLWLVAGAGAGSIGVPEPNSLMLLLIAAATAILARRRRFAASLAITGIAVLSLSGSAEAVVVKTIADAQLSENGLVTGIGDATDAGSGTGTNINARWVFSGATPNRNEWVALKFDLSSITNKSEIANLALKTYMFRTNASNSTTLHMYALTPGTTGEDWDEGTITYGSMPGFTFDGNSNTNLLSVGAGNPLTDLGTFSVSGAGNEGNIATINPATLNGLVQGMGSNNLLTVLISYQNSATGQWRIASREATSTETGVLTGAAGSFASYLQFDIVHMTSGVQGDYNDDGIVNAADYTIWRDNANSNFQLFNEEVSPHVVDIADYLYWKERFGATTPGGAGSVALSTSVPEPAVWLLAVVALGACLLKRST